MNTKMLNVGLVLLVIFSLLLPIGMSLINENQKQVESVFNKKIRSILVEQMMQVDDNQTLDVLVATRDDVDLNLILKLEARVGKLDVRRTFTVSSALEIRATPSQIEALAEEHIVNSLEWGDLKCELCDSLWEAQYYSHTDVLRSSTYYPQYCVSGAGITVAVVDSGIWTEHEDLDDGQVIAFRDIVGNGAYDDFSPPITGVDFHPRGHGTAMAGIIAGSGDASTYHYLVGLAPDAKLVGVRIQNQDENLVYSNLIDALNWVGNNAETYGIDIVSCSFGGPINDNYYGDGDTSDILARTADNLVTEYGLIVVAAAGNSGVGHTVVTPGSGKYTICVGAVNDVSEQGWKLWDDEIAFGSQTGPVYYDDIGNPCWYKPDVLAPGVNIECVGWQDNENKYTDSYHHITGTSPATAFVSGLVALYLDYDETLAQDNDGDHNPDVKQLLWASAVDVSGDTVQGIDGYYGAGRVDGVAGLDFFTKDVSSSRSSPKIISDYYVAYDEPMWRLDPSSYEDWYKYTSYASVHISMSFYCDPDLMVQVILYKGETQVAQDTSTSRGDDCFISYTGSYGTYYVCVRLTGDYGTMGHPGDYYDIHIDITSE